MESCAHVLQNARYDQIRTYEVVTQTQPAKEVLVTVVESGDPSRRPGVYFKEIGTKAHLRKTRAKVSQMATPLLTSPQRRGDADAAKGDLWDKSRVGFRVPDESVLTQRATAQDMVTDPGWINAQLRDLHDGENEAEGQGEAIRED